jgi:hypothetical protein
MSFAVDSVKRLFETPLTPQQYAAVASGTLATGLGVLALMYPDRAVFDHDDRKFPQRKGYPIVGHLPYIIANVDRIYDFMLENYETVGRTM